MNATLPSSPSTAELLDLPDGWVVATDIPTHLSVLDRDTRRSICGRRVSVAGGGEAARGDLITQVLDHCGTEWFPPSDWVADCDICGEDHRGEFGCFPPPRRQPFPGVHEDYECARCGWTGHGEDLSGPDGECPTCDSPAVKVVAVE